MNKTVKIITGIVALSCVLLYNFVHTGNILAAFIDPHEVGYIAAGGIEAIVIFLSMQISERRRDKRSTRLFVGALVAVVVVSALANIAQGYLVKFDKPIEMSVFGSTDFAQLVVWLSSTGLLSLVVFAMAEIIGDDMTQSSASTAQLGATTPQVWIDAKLTPAITEKISAVGEDDSQSSQNGIAPRLTDDTRLPEQVAGSASENAILLPDNPTASEAVLGYYQRNPHASMTQAAQFVAQVMGKPYTRQAVDAQLKRLEAQGKIERNGQVTVK